jgi:hypothetical protein
VTVYSPKKDAIVEVLAILLAFIVFVALTADLTLGLNKKYMEEQATAQQAAAAQLQVYKASVSVEFFPKLNK